MVLAARPHRPSPKPSRRLTAMEAFPGFHAMPGGGRLTLSVADLRAAGDCTEEDFLYVAPVANANGMYAAVVLYRGQLSPYFTSRVSLVDVKTQGDAWIAKNFDGATTIGNVLASVESNPGRLPGMVVNILKTIAAQ